MNLSLLSIPELTQLMGYYQSLEKELHYKSLKAQWTLDQWLELREKRLQRLQRDQQRAAENEAVLKIFSSSHPLWRKTEDDLYRTRIRIEKTTYLLSKMGEKQNLMLEIQAKKFQIQWDCCREWIKAGEGLISKREEVLQQKTEPKVIPLPFLKQKKGFWGKQAARKMK